MKLVVDANVLLAAFVKDAATRQLLLDDRLDLCAPEHLLSETSRHLQQSASLRKRVRLSTEQILQLLNRLSKSIRTFPQKAYVHRMTDAIELAPHMEDAPYLALALILDAAVWSNDKGFKTQTKVRVYSTHEVLDKLNAK